MVRRAVLEASDTERRPRSLNHSPPQKTKKTKANSGPPPLLRKKTPKLLHFVSGYEPRRAFGAQEGHMTDTKGSAQMLRACCAVLVRVHITMSGLACPESQVPPRQPE